MPDDPSFTIERVAPTAELALIPPLVHLLRDAVAGGASLGFLPPLREADAARYWSAVFAEARRGDCVLLVARAADEIVGAVQLALETKPNARHRAEARKLMTRSSQRRRGIGRALMRALERAAHDERRTLLVLDTRQGDDAERLYRALGYHEVGVIPRYASGAAGTLDGTVIFYKEVP